MSVELRDIPDSVPQEWHRNIAPASHYVTIWAGRNHHVCALKPTGWTAEQVEAHADLISAAPRLRRALVALLEHAYQIQDEGPPGEGWKSKELEAVIDEAKRSINWSNGIYDDGN